MYTQKIYYNFLKKLNCELSRKLKKYQDCFIHVTHSYFKLVIQLVNKLKLYLKMSNYQKLQFCFYFVEDYEQIVTVP